MIGVAAELAAPAIFNIDQEAAGVRAVECADAVANLGHNGSITWQAGGRPAPLASYTTLMRDLAVRALDAAARTGVSYADVRAEQLGRLGPQRTQPLLSPFPEESYVGR